MRLRERLASVSLVLFCALGISTSLALAQRDEQRDPLGFLKRALTEAGATALTADQESQLKTLITNFRNTRQTEPDTALEEARTAYNTALLGGDLAAAQAQAAIIANRNTELTSARLQAATKFQIDVVAVLKSGGQLDSLRQKLGDDRVVRLVGSLAGGPPFGAGRPGFGPGGPGLAPPPGESPARRPRGLDQS